MSLEYGVDFMSSRARASSGPQLWLPSGQSTRPSARLCLICVPHAGGMHTVYSQWQAFFSEDIEVRSIAMPGRGFRFREEPVTNIETATREIVESINALPWENIALFGDCSGAIIAYEVAKALQRSSYRRLLHLFAAGIPNPVTTAPSPRHTLSDDEFRDWAFGAGLIPLEFSSDTRSADYFLRQIRADYHLVEAQVSSADRIHCPINTFVGVEDPIAAESFDIWARLTTDHWQHCLLATGHLVGLDITNELKSLIAAVLATHSIRPSK
jgi:surfactin synthase thioesterase subunit